MPGACLAHDHPFEAGTRDGCRRARPATLGAMRAASCSGEVVPDRGAAARAGGRGNWWIVPRSAWVDRGHVPRLPRPRPGRSPGAPEAAAIPGKRSRTTSVPAARSPETLIALGRHHADHHRRYRRSAGSRRRAGSCGSRLAKKWTGSPRSPTTRMPGRDLADRAAAVQHFERNVVREDHEEEQDPRQRPHDAGCRCVRWQPAASAMMRRAPGINVSRRRATKPGTDTGEHEARARRPPVVAIVARSSRST